jgi:transposase-like protein
MAGIIEAHYQDEDAAREHYESIRWPDGPVCPHCGVIEESYKLNGKTTRKGLYKCGGCRQPFTVTVGTIFEDSKIPLHKWLLAIHLMCSSKKGISAHQLWRNLWGVNTETGKPNGSYRTAWFMAHRIRWALGEEPLASKLAGVVEIDETYVGGKKRVRNRPNMTGPLVKMVKQVMGDTVDPRKGHSPVENKEMVLSILQRDGQVRSKHFQRVTTENLKPMIDEVVEKSAHVMTDSSTILSAASVDQKHSKVNHRAHEYVRHEDGICVTTNAVEGYFATLKRGINGVYHHVGKNYLDQYLREFDFRHNIRKMNDDARFTVAVKKTDGKRLTLRNPKGPITS